jgi:hypothetical protein
MTREELVAKIEEWTRRCKERDEEARRSPYIVLTYSCYSVLHSLQRQLEIMDNLKIIKEKKKYKLGEKQKSRARNKKKRERRKEKFLNKLK